MCGVSGIVSPRAEALPRAIERMVATMEHRGPDGHGTFIDQAEDGCHLALGHNRLSIIDLSEAAAQPMRSADGRYTLVYNGEIYNYMEIAAELSAAELPPGGYGDTAIVLAALRKWGPDALEKFNGMWALLLYDSLERTLLVSRDRFGVKPLYYLLSNGALYLASEAKAILTACGTKVAVNANVVIPYLTRGLLDFSEQTFFEGVNQFPAASYAVLRLDERVARAPEPRRFWSHPYERKVSQAAGRVTPAELRTLFTDAVRLRLRSDVPAGVLLSGGVDSSAIVGAVASLRALGNLSVLSVISDDPTHSEEKFVDVMASYCELEAQKINVSKDPLALLGYLSEACWYNDGPVCGMADIAHQRLMELAHERGIKVLLSGQGADEQLGGYNKFLYFYLQSLLSAGNLWGVLRTIVQFARNSNTLYEFKLKEAIRYLRPSFLAKHSYIAPEHQHRDQVDIGYQGSYAKREWIDLVQTSVPTLLHYEDRMSMSQSVEVRVPFLDYRVVELLARVHPSEKLSGGWTKAIFRKAIAGLVPPAIQYRRDKKGFNLPEESWMRRDFRAHVEAMFSESMRAEDFGFIVRARLRRAYAKFVAEDGILTGRHFFRVMALEMFLRRYGDFLEARPTPERASR